MKRKLAIALAALVAGTLLVEGAVRLRQWWRFGTAFTYYATVADPESGLDVPEPGFAAGPVRINALGFRGPEIEAEKPASTRRIAFLGGSTTFCAEASALEKTWPHRVVEALREALPDVELDYVNGGGPGYSTRESLGNLEHRVAPLSPDVVVVYHGTNDLTKDTRELAAERGLHEPAEAGPSPLARWSAAWHLLEKNLRYRASRGGSAERARLEYDPAPLARAFEERLVELVDRILAAGALPVLVTFAPRIRAEQSPAERAAASTSSFYYMPYMTTEGLVAGFEAYNHAVRRAAERTGALLVGGEGSIPGDAAHYADSVHLTDEGCRLQAERVAAALLASDDARARLSGLRK